VRTNEPSAASALAIIPDCALELDARGTIVAANDAARAMFACEALAGRALHPLVPIGDLLTSEAQLSRAKLEGRRANGVPVLVEATLRRLEHGHALCVLRELSLRTMADEAERYFDAAFVNAPIGMAQFSCDGEYVRVNAALCELLGRTELELIGSRDNELTHPDDRQADVDKAWEILAGVTDTHQCEKRFLKPDGTVVWVLANLTFLRDECGGPLGWVGQFQDITARREAERALRDSEERFRLAFDHAPIGIALVSTEGRWLRVNRMVCEMLGYGEEQLLASTFQDITHPDDLDTDLEHLHGMLAGEIRTYEIEKRYFRADGSVVWALLSVSLARDENGAPLHFISQLQDIGNRKREQGELEQLAREDALTGALNRRAWDDSLERAVAAAGRTGEPFAVAVIDLNDFKQVNDTQGHAAGDRVLQEAVGAWRSQLREGDRLARLGGDEFAVLLSGRPGPDEALVRRLKRSLPHVAGCAVGVAAWRRGDDAVTLMDRADAALYADKG